MKHQSAFWESLWAGIGSSEAARLCTAAVVSEAGSDRHAQAARVIATEVAAAAAAVNAQPGLRNALRDAVAAWDSIAQRWAAQHGSPADDRPGEQGAPATDIARLCYLCILLRCVALRNGKSSLDRHLIQSSADLQALLEELPPPSLETLGGYSLRVTSYLMESVPA